MQRERRTDPPISGSDLRSRCIYIGTKPKSCQLGAVTDEGAPLGVAGTLADRGVPLIADIDFQVDQSNIQSKMSPSASDNAIRVPVTSTGSP